MLTNLLPHTSELILSEAIKEELTASHTYLHLSNQSMRIGYFKTAAYFAMESVDEREHYQKIANYINDRGSVAQIPSLDAIEGTCASLLELFEKTYEMELALEQKYSSWYKALANDPITAQFILQFLEIQRTSVGKASDILTQIRMAGDNKSALLIIDSSMGD